MESADFCNPRIATRVMAVNKNNSKWFLKKIVTNFVTAYMHGKNMNFLVGEIPPIFILNFKQAEQMLWAAPCISSPWLGTWPQATCMPNPTTALSTPLPIPPSPRLSSPPFPPTLVPRCNCRPLWTPSPTTCPGCRLCRQWPRCIYIFKFFKFSFTLAAH